MASIDAGSGGDEEDPEDRLARIRAQGGNLAVADPGGDVGTPPSDLNMGGGTGPSLDQGADDSKVLQGPYQPAGTVNPDATSAQNAPKDVASTYQFNGQKVDQYSALQALGSQPPAQPPRTYPGEQTQNPLTSTPPTPFQPPSSGGTGTNIPTKTTPTVVQPPTTGGGGTGTGTGGGGVLDDSGQTQIDKTNAYNKLNAGGASGTGGGAGGAGTGGAGTGTGGTGTAGGGTENLSGQPGSLQNATSDLLNQLNDLQAQVNNPGNPADVGKMYSTSLQSIIGMIDNEMANAKAEAEKQGTSLDPATEFTLGKMRDELDRQLKENDMKLNARGLFDSGINAQSQLDLRKSNMSDQAQVLSSRLSDIQNNLQKTLQGLSQKKVDTGIDYNTRAITGQLAENNSFADRQTSAQDKLLSARLGLRGQLGNENDAALSRQNQLQIAEQNRASQASIAQAQQNFEAAQNALTRNATAENQAAAQQAARELEQLRINAGQYSSGSGGGTINLTRPQGTTTLGQQALQSFQNAFMGENGPTSDPAAAFQRALPGLQRDGLTDEDIARIQEAAQQAKEVWDQHQRNVSGGQDYSPGAAGSPNR